MAYMHTGSLLIFVVNHKHADSLHIRLRIKLQGRAMNINNEFKYKTGAA